MARNGAAALGKCNSKLEAFLKRNLDEDTFERIRLHEACVVCSKKEDKAFKFAVLSDDWIYLTENPPKRITPEVHLGNIVSIKLVNDFPEFLSGAEQENTQHIVINFMRQDASKLKKSKDGSSSSSSPAAAAGPGDAASPRSIGGNLTYRGSLTARSGKAWQERKAVSMKEKGSEKTAVVSPRRTSSMDASMLRDALNKSSSKGGKKSKKKGGEGEEGEGEEEGVSTKSSSLQGSPKRQLPRPLPGRRAGPGEEQSDLDQTDSGELRLALEKLQEEEEEEEDVLSMTTGRLSPGIQNNNNNNDTLSKNQSRLSFLKRKKAVDSPENETEPEAEEEEWLPEELHIYILNLTSPILMLIRAAWNNYLIRETLEQDPEFLKRTNGFIEPRKTINEKLALLFAQLKTELLTVDGDDMEEMFSLINELKLAAERNFSIKKLFWKTPEMFPFLVKQVQKYHPKSPSWLSGDDENEKSQRADELEFVVLVLETIALMFRETEILSYRVNCLKAGEGKVVRDLTTLLVTEPLLPESDFPRPPTPTIADDEIEEICEELNIAATAVLAELILIAQQASLVDSDANFLNICFIVSVLDECDSLNQFLKRVVSSAIETAGPAYQDELPPTTVVTLFHQFSVLHTLIQYSPASAEFLRSNFYEEFKYFIQAPIVLAKLPKHYPIAETTIKLIEGVMSSILGKVINLNLNNVLS